MIPCVSCIYLTAHTTHVHTKHIRTLARIDLTSSVSSDEDTFQVHLQKLFGTAVIRAANELYQQIAVACPLLEELSGNAATACLRPVLHQSVTRLQWQPTTLPWPWQSEFEWYRRKKKDIMSCEKIQLELDTLFVALPKLDILRVHVGFAGSLHYPGPFQIRSSTLKTLDVRSCAKMVTFIPNPSLQQYVCVADHYGNGCQIRRRLRHAQSTRDWEDYRNWKWYSKNEDLSGCSTDEFKDIRMFSRTVHSNVIDFPRGCIYYGTCRDGSADVDISFSLEHGVEDTQCPYLKYYSCHGFLGPW